MPLRGGQDRVSTSFTNISSRKSAQREQQMPVTQLTSARKRSFLCLYYFIREHFPSLAAHFRKRLSLVRPSFFSLKLGASSLFRMFPIQISEVQRNKALMNVTNALLLGEVMFNLRSVNQTLYYTEDGIRVSPKLSILGTAQRESNITFSLRAVELSVLDRRCQQ